MVSRLPPATLNALFRLAFATAPVLNTLALPHTVTRRLIKQKARGQAGLRRTVDNALPLLVSARFQVLFHSPHWGAFHLSLTVLVHYRSRVSIQPWKMVLPASRGISRVPRYSGTASRKIRVI